MSKNRSAVGLEIKIKVKREAPPHSSRGQIVLGCSSVYPYQSQLACTFSDASSVRVGVHDCDCVGASVCAASLCRSFSLAFLPQVIK